MQITVFSFREEMIFVFIFTIIDTLIQRNTGIGPQAGLLMRSKLVLKVLHDDELQTRSHRPKLGLLASSPPWNRHRRTCCVAGAVQRC